MPFSPQAEWLRDKTKQIPEIIADVFDKQFLSSLLYMGESENPDNWRFGTLLFIAKRDEVVKRLGLFNKSSNQRGTEFENVILGPFMEEILFRELIPTYLMGVFNMDFRKALEDANKIFASIHPYGLFGNFKLSKRAGNYIWARLTSSVFDSYILHMINNFNSNVQELSAPSTAKEQWEIGKQNKGLQEKDEAMRAKVEEDNRQQMLQKLLSDPQELYGYLKEFIEDPANKNSQKVLRVFPFIKGYLHPQRNNLSPELLANIKDNKEPLDLTLIDHIFTRGLGQKILGLELADAKIFNKNAALSAENFQELASRYQLLKAGDVMPFFLVSFMYHEMSKIGNVEYRRRWSSFEGMDFQIPNKASANVLRHENFFKSPKPGLFNGLSFLQAHPHAQVLSEFFYRILENRGFSGQFVRGETTYDNFKNLTDWIKRHFSELKEAISPGATNAQAAHQITNIIFMFDFVDIASVNDHLLTDSLFGNIKSLLTDFESVIAPNANGHFDIDWQNIFDRRWNALATLNDKKAYLKDRLLRFRQGCIRQGEDPQKLSEVIDGLNQSQLEAFLKYTRHWQGWYVEQASFLLTPEAQLKLIALSGKIAELAGLSVDGPFNVTFYKLWESLFDENNELDLYKIRIIETFLRSFTWDDILLDEAHLKLLLKNDRNPLVSMALNMDGKLAVAVDFRFTKEAEHLLGLMHIYKTKNITSFHNIVKMLMDQYGLRKDEFDRVYNEMEYLRHMESSKWDKERLLAYAIGPVVLDVGPAGGAILSLLQKHKQGLDLKGIVGVDISKEALNDLELMKQREGWQNVRLVHGDAYQLDKVLAREHLERPSTIIFSSILHEIYSLIPGKEFRLENVRELLKMAMSQLQVGGRLLIRDGVIPEDGEEVQEMRLTGKEVWTFFEDYIREFKGRVIPYEIVEQDKDLTKTRIRLKRKDAMEFLYTYTWGPNSFPYEVREQYGVLTRKQYVAMVFEIAKELGMKLTEVEIPPNLQSYLQPGYIGPLKGKADLYDINGRSVDLPPSQFVLVLEKQSEAQARDKAQLALNNGRAMNINGATKTSKRGGIDLTPGNMNLQTRNAGEEIKFHMDPVMLRKLQNAPGFVPYIIDIQPLTDLRGFLGIKETIGNSQGVG